MSKITNDIVPVNKNINMEAQAMMHTCKATKCIIFLVNPNDHADYVIQEIEYDNNFFVTCISDKLCSFFRKLRCQNSI